MTKSAKALRAKRKELSEAEAALAAAEQSMNVDAVVDQRARVEALRTFVVSLEATARDEAEVEAKECAAAWVAQREEAVAGYRAAIAEAQAEVETRLAAVLEAIAVESKVRKQLGADALAVEILGARFDIPVDTARAALPFVEDYATPVLAAVDKMRPSRSMPRGLIVGQPANATLAQRRMAKLRAVHAWVARYGNSLPPDVLAIIEASPIPPDVPTDTRPGISEREEKEARAMAGMVKDASFALKFRAGGSL